MEFASSLRPARLLRRYKRFLADMALEDGTEVTAHCPNSGSMMGLAEPGMRCWIEPVAGRGRKLPFAWRLVELGGGHWAGIDATLPNRVVGEGLRAGRVPGLVDYPQLRAEVPYGTRSRVDFLLEGPRGRAFVEVKNVHLRRAGDLAEFPDCVTARGARHLAELAEVAARGDRAVLLYLVQRTDCTRLRLAADLDPVYARAAAAAVAAGVEVMAMGTAISPQGVRLGDQIPVEPPAAAPATARDGFASPPASTI
ncbi:MAG: DNA/RNA nuclease SfsA [Alkalilacustris sp.]